MKSMKTSPSFVLKHTYLQIVIYDPKLHASNQSVLIWSQPVHSLHPLVGLFAPLEVFITHQTNTFLVFEEL